MLVLTAASGNPYFFDHVLARRTNNNQTIGAAARTLGAFTWRTKSNPPLLTTALWVGELITIGVLAVLTFFFVALLTRGATRAVSVFVGTWAAVVLATVVAVIVRAILWYRDFYAPLDDPGRMGRIGYALFQAPSAPQIMYGFYAGIVTAVITALVFSASRRRAERRAETGPVAAGADGYPPPGYGYGDSSDVPPNYPGPAYGPSSEQVTAVLPPTGSATRQEQPTEPAAGWDREPHWDTPAATDESTRRLPTDRPADPDAPTTGRFG
jgi:hypothetical protein